MRKKRKQATIEVENPETFISDGQGNLTDVETQAEVVAPTVEQEVTKIEPSTVKEDAVPTADDIIKGVYSPMQKSVDVIGEGAEKTNNVWQKPDASQLTAPDESKLTIVDDMKQANQGLEFQDNVSSPTSGKENMYMNAVIQRAKAKGGLTAENIQASQKELGVPKQTLSALENDITLEKPKTEEVVKEVEKEKAKPKYEDALLELFQSQKPNVLKDLGFAKYKDYNVPDDLLNYHGKNLTKVVSQITDKDGKPISEEDQKKIIRRIRGIRAADALTKIANIVGQAVAVSQGGTPVKMDNSTILGNIHKNAQTKKDAWIKQMLDYKEKQDDNAYKMYTLGLKEKEIDLNALDKQARRQYENQKLAIDKALAENKITASQHQMYLGQAKLDAMIANNNARNAIAQQRADAYEAKNTAANALAKDYKLFTVGNSYQTINRHQIKSATGALVDALVKNTKAANDKKYTSDGAKQYWNGKDIEQIKKDAKASEQFIQEVLSSYPDMAKVVAPYFSDAETTVAVTSALGNPYGYSYGGDYSSDETTTDSEITDDYLDQ